MDKLPVRLLKNIQLLPGNLLHVAIENGPFIEDLPIKDGEFP